MIFFGSKGKTISGKVVEGIQCQNCESNKSITFGIIRYFHLYRIPTFITSKNVGIECTHCKKTLIGKELPKEVVKDIKGTVFNKKNTLPMFSGLLVIAFLAAALAYTVTQKDLETAAYIEQPAKNDLYIVNFTKLFTNSDPKYKYGVMRITQLSSGQVEFQVSQVAFNKASGARKDIRAGKASSDSYYNSEPVYFDVSELKTLEASSAIYSIERL